MASSRAGRMRQINLTPSFATRMGTATEAKTGNDGPASRLPEWRLYDEPSALFSAVLSVGAARVRHLLLASRVAVSSGARSYLALFSELLGI